MEVIMKKNKWFVLAALIGLALSVSFVIVGCAGNVWRAGILSGMDCLSCFTGLLRC
jgi:hypothetical protein